MAEEIAPEPGCTSFSSAVNGGKTFEECPDMPPMVKFLLKHLEQAGCGIGGRFIKASSLRQADCRRVLSGRRDEDNQVVIHELIRAFDDFRAANLNWANCAHHACREIDSCWPSTRRLPL